MSSKQNQDQEYVGSRVRVAVIPVTVLTKGLFTGSWVGFRGIPDDVEPVSMRVDAKSGEPVLNVVIASEEFEQYQAGGHIGAHPFTLITSAMHPVYLNERLKSAIGIAEKLIVDASDSQKELLTQIIYQLKAC